LNFLCKQNYSIVGWLAGDDRIDHYQENIYAFNPTTFLLQNVYCPISKKINGEPNVKFIKCERVLSGEYVRSSIKKYDFDKWYEITIGKDSNVVYEAYKEIFNFLQNIDLDKNNKPFLFPTMG
jgi:hypothetical protein